MSDFFPMAVSAEGEIMTCEGVSGHVFFFTGDVGGEEGLITILGCSRISGLGRLSSTSSRLLGC